MKERFLEDIENHKIHILKDDGIYRHIRFKKPNSGNLYFDLVTYPNYLVISGDMGEFVFTRVEDMFKFFRQDELNVNLHYWSEKCVASPSRGIREYDATETEKEAREYILDCFEHNEYDEKYKEVIEEFNDITYKLHESGGGDVRAYDALCEFDDEHINFNDAMVDGGIISYKPTHHYTWCLYAIVWGIQQYDNHKAEKKIND